MPRRSRSLAGVVRAAEDVLRRHRIEHVFVGAISTIIFGEVRTTRDVDILAKIPPAKVAALVADFSRNGFFASEEDLGDALREGGHSTLDDKQSPLRIDLAPATGAAAEHTLRTRVRVRWRGQTIPVASPETTIVMKLVYGSDQDREDAIGVYLHQKGHLDLKAMRTFARRQRVSEALRTLERQAESLTQAKR